MSTDKWITTGRVGVGTTGAATNIYTVTFTMLATWIGSIWILLKKEIAARNSSEGEALGKLAGLTEVISIAVPTIQRYNDKGIHKQGSDNAGKTIIPIINEFKQ